MLTSNIPLLNFSFCLDPLSLFFVTVIVLVSIAASIFSIDHIREMENKALFVPLFFAFIVSMLQVVTVSNAFAFLVCWEARSRETEKAGEIGVFMSLGMGFLAVLCLALGLFPAAVINFLDKWQSSLPVFPSGTNFFYSRLCFGSGGL